MKKPTILVITDNLRDQINGVVTTFNHLEKEAISDGYLIEFIDPSLFFHINCPGYPEIKLSLPFKIGEKILGLDPDYIHIATEGPIGFAARCWLDKHHWKYNTSYHTKFPEFLKKMYRIPEWITYKYLRWFHKHSGRVLVTTNTMAEELKQKQFRQDLVPWTRGVDSAVFIAVDEVRFQHKEKILLNVGRVSKEKGLDDFCSLKIPNTKKIVVGDGPYRKELQRKYPDVHFVGVAKGKRLAMYYSSADVFVFTSKTDTFGIVMIESMSCGTPVAGYSVPGPIDVIEQGVNGYYGENLEESIEKCLNLDRNSVYRSSKKWTWNNCWNIFKNNLCEK